MTAWKDWLDNVSNDRALNVADLVTALKWLATRDVGDNGLLDEYAFRADIYAPTSTSINFVSASANRPIRLQYDGRKAVATAAPTALAMNTTSTGTWYFYVDLGVPDANGISAITWVKSSNAPESENTSYRQPLGEGVWNGTAWDSVTSYHVDKVPANLYVTSFGAFGAAPAPSGNVRIPNSGTIGATDSAGTGTGLISYFRDVGSVSHNATATLGIGGVSNPTATVRVQTSQSEAGAFMLRGALENAERIFTAPSTAFATSTGPNLAASTGKTAIYWSTANSRYEIENQTGSTMIYRIWYERYV